MRWYAVLAVFLLLGASPASAQYARDRYDGDGGVRSLDQILPGVRHSRPGTFYDAEGPFRGADGRMHYRLKWMTPQGRIIWLDTDARSGRVLGEARGVRRPAWERGRQRGGADQRRYAPQDRRRYAPRDQRYYAPPAHRGRQFQGDRGRSGRHDWRQGNRNDRGNRDDRGGGHDRRHW